jgi:hypothetical protein
MATLNDAALRESLLQEGVSCALATLHAIEGADLFGILPEGDKERHNHGCWLLSMLSSHLADIQQRVDVASGIAQPPAEGR